MAAARAATERRGGDFKLFASPWSPPAWLKAPRKKFEPDPDHPSIEFPGNRSMLSSAQPDGLAHDEQAHAAWALYFSKFASAYEAQGLPLWGFTVQNEPEFSAPWEACRYTANSTGAFVRDFLGPRLKSDHPHLKLFVFDHNRDHMVDWARGHGEAANRRAAPAVRGLQLPGIGDSDLLRSERYAHDILSDLALGACGWVDWNLLLDHRGGPNHLGNVCDAPMHATDEKFSGVKIQSYYDVIGHFSKHLHPGSERVEISVDGVFFDDRAATRAAARRRLRADAPQVPGSPDRRRRQAWALDDVHDYLEMTDGSFVDKWGDLCAADANTPGVGSLALVNCEYGKEHGDVAVGKFRRDPDSHAIAELKGGLCLGPSRDRPGAEGAQLELQPCDGANRHQRFTHLPSGALVSDADGRCVTAGWPFVQAVAFARPTGDVAVVALNEASHAADFDLDIDGGVRVLGPHDPDHVVSRGPRRAPAPGDDDGAVKLTDDPPTTSQLKAKLGPV
ncbi:glucosylceramidase [Aureococcus anophagefferens]|nr:glucosylceramidase [Aureococcus anophagefferens]